MKRTYFNHFKGNIHPVYQELLNNSPEGIEFINKFDYGNNYEKTAIKKDNFILKLKGFFISFLKIFYFLPNITFKKLPGEIIYSCGSIPLFGDYFLDLEAYEALNRFSNKISNNLFNKLVVKFFLKQNRCKKIILWSQATKKGLEAYLGKQFDNKIEVRYPTILINHNLEEIYSWKNKEKIEILFVGRYFERKGGLLVLEIAESLTKKYSNLTFNFITQVPDEITLKYLNNSQINFLGLLSREKTLEYFKKSHIYLMPTFLETFGMVFLESFAYGAIPISLDTYAIKEIISDNIDGFVIDYKNKFYNQSFQYIDKYNSNINILLEIINNDEKEEIIKKIVDKIEFLINNEEIRNKFILNGFEKVKN